MNIGVFVWDSFGLEDIIEAFEQLGHRIIRCMLPDMESVEGEKRKEAGEKAEKWLRKETPDVFFSFNYYPAIADACKKEEIFYIAWVYDSPHVRMYDYSIAFPTNLVFVFDSEVYREFHEGNVNTVYYLPMAANVSRLQQLGTEKKLKNTKILPQCGVSFVGSLYTEKHCFYQRLTKISEYTRGYLEGLIRTQQLVYGDNFIQRVLPKPIIEDMRKSLPLYTNGIESLEYLFAQYVINREITSRERKELLKSVGQNYGMDLYTPDKTVCIEGCINHGVVDAYDEAPYVYKASEINLNITLRSIIKGIPLRAFEIMGSGGFLLTNYQEDFLHFFIPGEDFVYFESKEDLSTKISYYLKNDAERKQIAQNGLKKIAEGHTYLHRAEEMLSYIKE